MDAVNFKILMTNAYPAMMRQAMVMLQDQDKAKDVVQEVTVRLWQRPQGLEHSDNKIAYCVAAVRNTAVSALRMSVRFESLDAAPDVADTVQYDDNFAYLKALMARLPDTQQRVFEMRQLRDMEYDDIASALNTTSANVRQLLSRARKTLRTLYKQTI